MIFQFFLTPQNLEFWYSNFFKLEYHEQRIKPSNYSNKIEFHLKSSTKKYERDQSSKAIYIKFRIKI